MKSRAPFLLAASRLGEIWYVCSRDFDESGLVGFVNVAVISLAGRVSIPARQIID